MIKKKNTFLRYFMLLRVNQQKIAFGIQFFFCFKVYPLYCVGIRCASVLRRDKTTKMTPKASGPDYLSSLATRISLVRSRAAHLTVTPIMLLHEALQWLTTLEAPSAVVVPHESAGLLKEKVEDRGGPGPHGPRLLDDNPRVLVVNDVTWAKKWNVAALIDQIKSMEVPRELQCLKKMETMGREAAHLEEDKPFEQDLNANEMFMNLLLDALVDETS
eukprot:GEMP01056756.1.p1 GENE.GEMP01056756.1~~GEMP01056756.1.p1  ORF type:complete len:217 (+),score=42.09 GEMP01056756.1:529-1179(+)